VSTFLITGLATTLALVATMWLAMVDHRQPRRERHGLARGAQVIRLKTPEYEAPTGLHRVRAMVGWGGFTLLLGLLTTIAITAVAVGGVLAVQQLLG
jgi:hypothetical protein